MTNICIIEGRITKDLELKTTTSGKNVLSFSIANDDGFGDKKETSFINVVAWESLAQTISKFCHKGSHITISGKLKQRNYENNGEKRSVYEIIARDISFLDKKESSGNPANIPFSNSDTEDELPF